MTVTRMLSAQNSIDRYVDLPNKVFDKNSSKQQAIEEDLKKQNKKLFAQFLTPRKLHETNPFSSMKGSILDAGFPHSIY